MAEMAFCPFARLLEAVACGTPILSDSWAGLEEFFERRQEIIVAKTSEDVIT